MLLHVQSCNCLVYADALLDGLCSFLCGFSLQIQLKFVLLEFVFDLLCSWSLHSFGLIYCAKKRSAQVFQLLAGFVSPYWWNISHSWWKRHVITVLSLTLLIVLRLIYRSVIMETFSLAQKCFPNTSRINKSRRWVKQYTENRLDLSILFIAWTQKQWKCTSVMVPPTLKAYTFKLEIAKKQI